MPRKAKENEEIIDKKIKTSAKAKSANTKKVTKSTAKENKTSASSSAQKATSKKTSPSTEKKTSKKNTSTTTKKSSTKKDSTVAKKSSTKTTTKKKTPAKKSTSTKAKSKSKVNIIEYYDLPQKYNQTVVKILAQTPKRLFIYWEISDDDISNFKKQYGENFFETTKPVLIIHNETLNYSFEVEVNDFANSWYLQINDSKSNYKIELGRRPYVKSEQISTDYIYITSSNKLETPNDHILFNNSEKMIYFRNVKTNQETQKPFTSLSFMRNMGKIYNIYDLYHELYQNEDDLKTLSNPSS